MTDFPVLHTVITVTYGVNIIVIVVDVQTIKSEVLPTTGHEGPEGE